MATEQPHNTKPPYVWQGTIQVGDLPQNPSITQADEVMRVVSDHFGQRRYAIKLSGWWRILCQEAAVGWGAAPGQRTRDFTLALAAATGMPRRAEHSDQSAVRLPHSSRQRPGASPGEGQSGEDDSPVPDDESQADDSDEHWEDIRAMTARVGDITPAGPIEAIDYFGTIGVVLTINGQDHHRGIDAVISRKMPS